MLTQTLVVKPSKTIVARYAELPIVTTSRRFLVQVMEPIPLVPREFQVNGMDKVSFRASIGAILLAEWQGQFGNVDLGPRSEWVHEVNKVEFVECDLLVPKVNDDESRKKMFSVTAADCEFKAKRGSGKGGQARNKTSNAIQCFHAPSGAMGECEDGRHQSLNRRTAFERMVKSPEFQTWLQFKIDAGLGKVEIEEPTESGSRMVRKLRVDEV